MPGTCDLVLPSTYSFECKVNHDDANVGVSMEDEASFSFHYFRRASRESFPFLSCTS
jgi:hypothetical protein